MRSPLRHEADGRRRPFSPQGQEGAGPLLSIVVPTKDEAGNVRELVARLESELPGYAAEVLFVDDSKDDTPDVVRAVSVDACIEVILVHRRSAERWGGLGGAVVDGIRVSRGSWVCVMDGDLQHPPEVVPKLLDLAAQGLDLVVAGRSRSGPGDGHGLRRLLSLSSTSLAKALFPRILRGIDDPLSGFFLVRRTAVDLAELRPRGFKILLELIVRSSDLRVGEVVFDFEERFHGRSKASVREGFRYLALLASLRLSSPLTSKSSTARLVDESVIASPSG